MLLNRERAMQLMRRDGLEAIVATSAENITYCTDYFGINPYIYMDLEMYALIPADPGQAALFVVPIDTLDYLAQRPTWIADVRVYGTYHMYGTREAVLTPNERVLLEMRENLPHYDTALDALEAGLKDRGLVEKRIGFDERVLSLRREAAIRERLAKARIVPCFDLFREIRVVKTLDQVALMRQAADILEAGIGKGFHSVRRGSTEIDFWRVSREEIARLGATPTHWETNAGTRSAGGMPPSDYQIKQGDVVRLEGGCRYEWNFADTGRTAVAGRPTANQQRIYDAILAGERAALDMVRPGVHPSEMFDAAVEAVRKGGLDQYQRHHVGHSIGLEMYEMPLLVPASKRSDIHDIGKGELLLEPNMIINVETPYYELGVGGFQIEDTVVVTESGFDYLTQGPRDIWIIPF